MSAATQVTQIDKNKDMLNYFFSTLATSCIIVIFIPSIAKQPNNLLFCYFFIAFSVIALFLNWSYAELNDKQKPLENIPYYFCALLFIFSSILTGYIVTNLNKKKLESRVYDQYYGLIVISNILLLFSFYYFYQMANMEIKDRSKMVIYNIFISAICFLNIFVTITNSIGVSRFSADG